MEIGPGTRTVVTGASRGIGAALARELAERGCEVGLMARSVGELQHLVSTLPGDGHEPLAVDVGDRDQVRAAIESFGSVDLLVANAGVATYGPFAANGADAVERMTRVNWLGTVYAIDAVLPGMLDRGRGHLVVMSSGAAFRSFPEAAGYGATKAAQRAFAEALRHELHGTGVSLTTVYPGEIATHLHDHERDSMPAWYRGGERAADPAALARRVVEAVEHDRSSVHYPPIVKTLRISHGISPRLADFVLRRLRGPSAAPRGGH